MVADGGPRKTREKDHIITHHGHDERTSISLGGSSVTGYTRDL